ncbi:MAG: hypothetical protein ACO4AH_08360, partial [Burkholderiaceae bacterium]
HLALESLPDAGWQGQGNLPLQALPRLSAELHQPQGQLFWSLALGQRAGADGRAQLWLQAHAHAELPLLCQRCLPALPVQPQGTPGGGPQAAPADPNQTPHPFAALAALRKG